MVKDLVLSLPWPKFNPWSQLRFHKGPGAAKKKKFLSDLCAQSQCHAQKWYCLRTSSSEMRKIELALVCIALIKKDALLKFSFIKDDVFLSCFKVVLY